MAAASAGRAAGLIPGPAAGPAAGRPPARSRPARPCGRLGSAVPSRSPARRPVIIASVSELEASRFAPCTPVEAASPTAYSPATWSARPGRPGCRRSCSARRARPGSARSPGRCRVPGRPRSPWGSPAPAPPGQRGGVQPQVTRGVVRLGPSAAAWPPTPRRGAPGRRAGDGRPSPAARRVDQHRPGAAQRLGDQRALRRGPAAATARSGGTGRTRRRAARPRPGPPAPARPRSARPGWWWCRTPGRIRRWPGPRPARTRRPAAARRRG